ncbi:MAG: 6-phosphogluconolactonase [Pirellulaceae bacterium]
MTDIEMHQFENPNEMSLAAAEALISLAAQATEARGRFVFALSGGSTPRGLYQALTTVKYRKRLDWNRVEFFWGDERTVPPDHEESNYRMALDTLLKPLGVHPAHTHRIEADRDDLEPAAAGYAAEIARCFEASLSDPPPRFDLILLGLGQDGHTASLFPHTEALRATDRWVVTNHVPQRSTTRITMTIPLINRARAVFFLVAGDEKAAALARVIHGPMDPARFPGQMIHPTDGRLVWFVDRRAARQLDKHVEQQTH